MITDKHELKYFLQEDLKRFNNRKPNLKDWIVRNESIYIYRYIRLLRYVEYHKNVGNKLRCLFYFLRYKRLGFRLNFTIYPNTIGPGFRIYHLGSTIHIKSNCCIGKNCTIYPGVVIGNKYVEDDDTKVIVGDNCYLGLGCKIVGNVKVGDNVTIGPNSVVTKDVPSNCIVGGIPARILRQF